MTTIRRTRLSRSHPVDAVVLDSGALTPPSPDPRDTGDDGETVRLALIDPPAERTTLDGAWWPRTRSLTGELPGLVEELHRRGIRVTRVAYNPGGWDPAPRRLAADGRIIRLGWFRSIDPQLLNLTGDFARRRIDLLVVPPDTTAAAARQAFIAATDPTNQRTPRALLAGLHQAGPSVPRPRPAADRLGVPQAAGAVTEETAVWESEGGHPRLEA